MRGFLNRLSRSLSLKTAVLSSLAVLSVFSCSTTRSLEDSQYRLAKNRIEVTNDDKFNPRQLHQYLKQQPDGLSPFLYVYNWSGKKANNVVQKFFRKVGKAPVVYEPDLVESSVQNIRNHLEYIGYYDSKVTSEVRLDGKNVKVLYNVSLGNRIPVSTVRFNVPSSGEFASDFYQDTVNVTVKPGSYLSEQMLESESERSAAVMREKGYYGFSKNHYFFEADTITKPGSAILEMRVAEYTRSQSEENAQPIRKFRIGDVSISRPVTSRFREKVLRDMNTIVPGEPYSEKAINNTYSRFSSLRTFSSVNVGLNPVDTATVDCNISLTQSKLQSTKYVVELSSNSSGLIGFSPQLSYTHKNIFHGGEWLNLSFLGNFQFMFNEPTRSDELGVTAGISLPKFLGLPSRLFKGPTVPRTEITSSFNLQDRPEYLRYVVALQYGYSGKIGGKFFYQYYPVQANVVSLDKMTDKFKEQLAKNPFLWYAYQDHFDEGSGMTLYYTTNSDVVPRDSYHYYRFSGDLSGNAVSLFNPLLSEKDGFKRLFGLPYSQYVRAELTLGKTWRFGRNDGQAVATRLLAGAGYAYGNSTALPYEKQFYSGGANSLRGWQARSVGPGSAKMSETFSIPSQTGDMKLEANIEYRFRTFWKIEGAAFVDAGNVWTLNSTSSNEKTRFDKDFYKSIAADWGLGLRVDLSFILVRFDLGMQFYDPALDGSKWISPKGWLKKNNFALHFGVGYPF